MSNSPLDFILNNNSGMHDTIIQSREYKRRSDEVLKISDEILSIIGGEHKALINKLSDAQVDCESESCEAYFKEGVKFGIRFILECLGD